MTRRPATQRDLFGAKATHVERSALVDRELVHESAADTAKAYAVRRSAFHDLVFLPRSQTELHGGVFTFPEWLAREKGLL